MGATEALTKKKCQPCEGIGKALNAAQIKEYLLLTPGWAVDADGKGISREFVMKNFLAAVRSIGQIADIAEAENHHPDIHLTGYRKLKICLTTHALGGLSENDFIVAAKISALEMELKK
jgi:4a-hydroxytetrahydrobiopterin dehydratase